MENLSKCNKPRCVAFLVYPSSDQLNDIMGFIDNLKHQIEYDGFAGFISPLHQPDEDDKVPHLHCVLVRPPRKGFEIGTWRGICSHYGAANGFVLVPSAPSGYCEYLLHRNNPDKQQFDEQHTVTCVGGLDYSACCSPSYWGEKVKLSNIPSYSFADVVEFINSHGTESFAELIDLLMLEQPDMVDYASKKSHSILNYLKSISWTHKYDSANKTGYNEAIGKVLRVIHHNPQYFTDSLAQQQLMRYISDNL